MPNDSAPAKRGSGLSFSLAAILFLVALICYAFGIWKATRHEVTTAYLEISHPSTAALSQQEVDRRNSSQVALFKSPLVIQSVLADPRIRQLPNVSQQGNPETWLQERLYVSFANDSPILQLRLEGRSGEGIADAEILKALIEAQRKSAVFAATVGSAEPVMRIIQPPVVTTQ